MGRTPCCSRRNEKRVLFSLPISVKVLNFINFSTLCRSEAVREELPSAVAKHGSFTEEEDNTICSLYNQMGSRQFESTEFCGFTQLQSSLLQCLLIFYSTCTVKSMKSGSFCPVYKIPYRRRGMNHDNFMFVLNC
ncbi:hypothetical protein ACFX2I_009677 [Malus domestica]